MSRRRKSRDEQPPRRVPLSVWSVGDQLGPVSDEPITETQPQRRSALRGGLVQSDEGRGMTDVPVRAIARLVLDGWTEDYWCKGKWRDGERVCLGARILDVLGGPGYVVVAEAIENVIARRFPGRGKFVGEFNDHRDTTFEDIREVVREVAA